MSNKKQSLKAEKEIMKKALLKEFNKNKPNPIFRDILFTRLVNKYLHKQDKGKHEKGFFVLFFRSVFLGMRSFSFLLSLVILTVSMGITTGYAYISPNVNRESNLYFLKRFVEEIEYDLTFSDEGKVKKNIKFAERRLEEVVVLADGGVVDKASLNEISANINEAIEIVDQIEDPVLEKEMENLITDSAKNQKETLLKVVETIEKKQEIKIIEPVSLSSEVVRLDSKELVSVSGEISRSEEIISETELFTETIKEIEQTTTQNSDKKVQLSDLVITGVDLDDFKLGKISNVYIKINNLGEIDANEFFVEIDWGDGIVNRSLVNSLLPQEALEINFFHYYERIDQYDVKVVLDSTKLIDEINENNNKNSFIISVKEAERPDECEYQGLRKCNGDYILECNNWHNQGYLSFENTTSCGDGYFCDDGECIQSCENQCSTIGRQICSGNKVQVCRVNNSGCLIWQTINTCDSSEQCSLGICEKKITNQCTRGARECIDGKVRVCTDLNNDGYTEWKYENCASGTTCQQGQCIVSHADECFYQGQKKCVDNAVYECDYWNAEPYLSWNVALQCGSDRTCENGKCLLPLPSDVNLDDFEQEL